MPQISLYIDKATLEKIEKAANAEKTSISKWVGKQLKKSFLTDYPDDYKNLFGAIRDESFSAPERKPFDTDTKRESFE